MTQFFLAAGNLSDSMRKLVNENFINVDGVLVEKSGSGYIVFGKPVQTMEQVYTAIKNGRGYLNNSIKK